MWVDLVGWVKNLNQMEQTYLVCHHQVCDPLDSDLRELFVGHWALIVTWLLGQVSSLLCAYIKWSIGAVCGLFRPQTTNHWCTVHRPSMICPLQCDARESWQSSPPRVSRVWLLASGCAAVSTSQNESGSGTARPTLAHLSHLFLEALPLPNTASFPSLGVSEAVAQHDWLVAQHDWLFTVFVTWIPGREYILLTGNDSYKTQAVSSLSSLWGRIMLLLDSWSRAKEVISSQRAIWAALMTSMYSSWW